MASPSPLTTNCSGADGAVFPCVARTRSRRGAVGEPADPADPVGVVRVPARPSFSLSCPVLSHRCAAGSVSVPSQRGGKRGETGRGREGRRQPGRGHPPRSFPNTEHRYWYYFGNLSLPILRLLFSAAIAVASHDLPLPPSLSRSLSPREALRVKPAWRRFLWQPEGNFGRNLTTRWRNSGQLLPQAPLIFFNPATTPPGLPAGAQEVDGPCSRTTADRGTTHSRDEKKRKRERRQGQSPEPALPAILPFPGRERRQWPTTATRRQRRPAVAQQARFAYRPASRPRRWPQRGREGRRGECCPAVWPAGTRRPSTQPLLTPASGPQAGSPPRPHLDPLGEQPAKSPVAVVVSARPGPARLSCPC